jgi:hypothetical protein
MDPTSYETTMAPHPCFENHRQSSHKSVGDENTNIKGAPAVAETNGLPRPSSSDSLLGYSTWTGELDTDANTSYDVPDDFRQQNNEPPQLDIQETAVPLRQWIANDITEKGVNTHLDPSHQMIMEKASTLRKVTIAYATAKLMQHLSSHSKVNLSSEHLEQLFSIDNFLVRTGQSDLGWEVVGVDMIKPSLQLQIINEEYSSGFFDASNVNSDDFMGRKVSADITSPFDHAEDIIATKDETMLCHLLGIFLYGLFVEENVINAKPRGLPKDDRDFENRPLEKKQSLLSGNDFLRATSISRTDTDKRVEEREIQAVLKFQPLSWFGYSSSLSQLVTHLIDCGLGLFRSCDSYPSLEMAVADFCLLLEEPRRFLFDDFLAGGKPTISLEIGKGNGRLYGRTKEADLITDTFCRVVSKGESEAICELPCYHLHLFLLSNIQPLLVPPVCQ